MDSQFEGDSTIIRPLKDQSRPLGQDVDNFISLELTSTNAIRNMNKILHFRDRIQRKYDLWRNKFNTQLFELDEFQVALLDRVFGIREKYEKIKSDPDQNTYIVDEGLETHLLGSGIHSSLNTKATGLTLAYPHDLYTIVNTLGKQRREVPIRHADIPFEDLKLYFVPSISGGFGLGKNLMRPENDLSLYAHIVALDKYGRILITPYDRSISMKQLDGVSGRPKVVCGETRLSTFELCTKSGVPSEGVSHWSKKVIMPNDIFTPFTGGYAKDGLNGISALATFENDVPQGTQIPDNLRLRTMLYFLSSIISNSQLSEGPKLLE